MFTTPKPTPALCLYQIFILSAILLLAGSASAYSGGDGTRLNPYQIADVNDLLYLGSDEPNYGKYFILVADINLAGYDFNTAVIAPYTSDQYGTQGVPFSGSFDGACHKISNLTINGNRGSDYGYACYGLFGQTDYIENLDEYGYYWNEIKNINLENVRISSTDNYSIIGGLIGDNDGVPITNCHININGNSYSEYIGGLAGYNSGNINNCSSEGNIFITSYPGMGALMVAGGLIGDNGDDIINSHSDCNVSCDANNIAGWVHIGGLVGLNGPYDDYGYTNINNCYSTGNIYGDGNMAGYFKIGGLIGTNESAYYSLQQSTINRCFSASPVIVTVNVSGDNLIGGLVGSNYGEINDCYSTGPVTDLALYCDGLGGLVGNNSGYQSLPAIIRNCYSVGKVTLLNSSGYAGGLVGSQYWSPIITHSYFLDVNGPANGYGMPLTDAQMKQQASFVGWDFVGETINGTEDVWWLLENVTYPKLNWQRKLPSGGCGGGGPGGPGGTGSGDGGIYFPDYNFDNFVNFLDFAIFADAWLTENPFISLDNDNDVDINDLKIFCDHWLKGL